MCLSHITSLLMPRLQGKILTKKWKFSHLVYLIFFYATLDILPFPFICVAMSKKYNLKDFKCKKILSSLYTFKSIIHLHQIGFFTLQVDCYSSYDFCVSILINLILQAFSTRKIKVGWDRKNFNLIRFLFAYFKCPSKRFSFSYYTFATYRLTHIHPP